MLTVGLPTFGDLYPPDRLGEVVALAVVAEEAGLDGVVVPEHVAMGPHSDRYPYGTFPFPPDAPWLDALTVLTAMAALTHRVRLQTGILIAAARPAAVLAKQAATLDVLSGGRLDLGVGTGWQAEELEACGVPFAERGPRLTETIAACRALWSPGPSTFTSSSTSPSASFEDLWCEPSPVSAAGPPVLFSGTLTARNLQRITELGDGWIPLMGETLDGLAAGVATLRAAWSAAGRDPAQLRVRGSLPVVRDAGGEADVDATVEGAPALLAAGATEVTMPLRAFVSSPDQAPEALHRIGACWRRVHG